MLHLLPIRTYAHPLVRQQLFIDLLNYLQCNDFRPSLSNPSAAIIYHPFRLYPARNQRINCQHRIEAVLISLLINSAFFMRIPYRLHLDLEESPWSCRCTLFLSFHCHASNPAISHWTVQGLKTLQFFYRKIYRYCSKPPSTLFITVARLPCSKWLSITTLVWPRSLPICM